MASGGQKYPYTGQAQYLSMHTAAERGSGGRTDRGLDRPFPVTVIALSQLAKAAFLLAVAALHQLAPDALNAVPLLPFLLYAAAHGRDTHGFLLPIVGIFVAIVGYGLWTLKSWSRRSLIASTGLMLIVWGHRFFVDQMNGVTTLKTPLEQKTVTLVLFLDAVVFLYMVAYDDIHHAFAKKG